MRAKFVFVTSAILLVIYGICEGLECYHCYVGDETGVKDSRFVPCIETNLTLSNTMICPHPKAQCIYETVEVEFTKSRQIWRTYSNGLSDPCDPNSVPPGVKMISCTYCGTDRCNLQQPKEPEKNNNNTFTFNINANINLYIRQ